MWDNGTKQTGLQHNIYNIVSIKYWVIEIWTALNLSRLCLRLSGSICVGWLRLAQQYAKDV